MIKKNLYIHTHRCVHTHTWGTQRYMPNIATTVKFHQLGWFIMTGGSANELHYGWIKMLTSPHPICFSAHHITSSVWWPPSHLPLFSTNAYILHHCYMWGYKLQYRQGWLKHTSCLSMHVKYSKKTTILITLKSVTMKYSIKHTHICKVAK